jgi:hypothetical protein
MAATLRVNRSRLPFADRSMCSATLAPLKRILSVPAWPSTVSLPSPGCQTKVSSPAPSSASPEFVELGKLESDAGAPLRRTTLGVALRFEHSEQSAECSVESALLGRLERLQQALLVSDVNGDQLVDRAAPLACQLDECAAAVVGVWPAFDQPGLGEAVKSFCDPA